MTPLTKFTIGLCVAIVALWATGHKEAAAIVGWSGVAVAALLSWVESERDWWG